MGHLVLQTLSNSEVTKDFGKNVYLVQTLSSIGYEIEIDRMAGMLEMKAAQI